MNRKGKHMKIKSKNIFINIMALCLLISVATKITHAKYTSEINQDTFNIEFIAGDIELTLTDNTNEFIIVPGKVLEKEVKVTVKENSEACYLFVKIENLDSLGNYTEYEIENEWIELAKETNIYYRELSRATADTDLYIFKDNQIIVKDTITKQEIEETNNITLNITAYAVQKTSEIPTVIDAWNLVGQ